MKIIHLSDLHIGKRLNGYSLLNDQVFILNQIKSIIDAENPDAVIIAGDVYDKTVPPAEAVPALDDFLCSLKRYPILMISGNHDSPERLAFASRLLSQNGLHISPVYKQDSVAPVIMEDQHGPVYFYMLPFVRPAQVRQAFPEEETASFTDAVRTALAHMNIDYSQRNVLITHQFITGSERSDSENSVGGADNVDASVFDGLDYVALGHLHGPQNVGGSPRIRYCGTPLKYSFSEAKQEKSVSVITLGAKGEFELKTVPLRPAHDMRKLKGTFMELTDRSSYEGTAVDDYLHITLTDEQDIPDAMARLRITYPNIMSMDYDNTRTRTQNVIDGAEQAESKSPLELFAELYEQQNGQPFTSEQRDYVESLINSIWEED
ncbi:exonuclease SbcCD subunit D [bacterium]|nr:exonuclease SbcCD subunit D [bacterium]